MRQNRKAKLTGEHGKVVVGRRVIIGIHDGDGLRTSARIRKAVVAAGEIPGNRAAAAQTCSRGLIDTSQRPRRLPHGNRGSGLLQPFRTHKDQVISVRSGAYISREVRWSSQETSTERSLACRFIVPPLVLTLPGRQGDAEAHGQDHSGKESTTTPRGDGTISVSHRRTQIRPPSNVH